MRLITFWTFFACLLFVQLSTTTQAAKKGIELVFEAEKFAVTEIKNKHCQGQKVSIPPPPVVIDSYVKQENIKNGVTTIVHRPFVSGIAFCKTEDAPTKTLHWTVLTKNNKFKLVVETYEMPLEMRL